MFAEGMFANMHVAKNMTACVAIAGISCFLNAQQTCLGLQQTWYIEAVTSQDEEAWQLRVQGAGRGLIQGQRGSPGEGLGTKPHILHGGCPCCFPC